MKKYSSAAAFTAALLLIQFASACGASSGGVPEALTDIPEETASAAPAAEETEAPETDGIPDTDMNGWMSKEDRAQVEDEIPFGRMATPKECAEMLLLLSHAPRYLTGQVIDFDGAWI